VLHHEEANDLQTATTTSLLWQTKRKSNYKYYHSRLLDEIFSVPRPYLLQPLFEHTRFTKVLQHLPHQEPLYTMDTPWEAENAQAGSEEKGTAKLLDDIEQSLRSLRRMIVDGEVGQQAHQAPRAAKGMTKNLLTSMDDVEDLWCRIRQMVEEAEAARQVQQARRAAQEMPSTPEADRGNDMLTRRFFWEMNQGEQVRHTA
jgi:hypothetical protein